MIGPIAIKISRFVSFETTGSDISDPRVDSGYDEQLVSELRRIKPEGGTIHVTAAGLLDLAEWCDAAEIANAQSGNPSGARSLATLARTARELAADAKRGFAPPARKPVTNLAPQRGDVRRAPGGKLAVIARVEWRDPSWAVEWLQFAGSSHDVLSVGQPQLSYITSGEIFGKSWMLVGRWDGPIAPAAKGRLIPSDSRATFRSDNAESSGSNNNKEEATVPTVTRSKPAKAKPVASPKTTNGKSASGEAVAQAAAKRARRTADEVDALVPQFQQHLASGGKMKELKTQFGFSDDGPIRAALYRAGFDSKGAEHGEAAGSIDASKAKGKQQVAKLRGEGAGWYRLAYLTGLGESELKAIVSEAGGSTGRVYTQSEKPAKAPKAAKTEADANAERKGTGKRVSRRAVKADPS